MPDDPITLTTLTQFYCEVMLPDVQRVVDGAVGRLRDEMNARFAIVDGHFNAMHQRFDRLETDYRRLPSAEAEIDEIARK